MMKKLLVFFAVLTSVSSAQTTPSVVSDATSPVRLVSNLATATDFMAGVTIASAIGRNVTKVSIGLIVTIPQQCNAHSFVSKERVRSFDVSLAPGESTTLTNLHLSPIGMKRLIDRLHAQDVLSQIAVVGATYDDGTSWHLTRSTMVYDSKMMAADITARCGSGQRKTFTTSSSLPSKASGLDDGNYWRESDDGSSDGGDDKRLSTVKLP